VPATVVDGIPAILTDYPGGNLGTYYLTVGLL
jgi:hypothetical protein